MTRDAAPNDRDGVLFYGGSAVFSGRCGFRSVVPEERTALTSSKDTPGDNDAPAQADAFGDGPGVKPWQV